MGWAYASNESIFRRCRGGEGRGKEKKGVGEERRPGVERDEHAFRGREAQVLLGADYERSPSDIVSFGIEVNRRVFRKETGSGGERDASSSSSPAKASPGFLPATTTPHLALSYSPGDLYSEPSSLFPLCLVSGTVFFSLAWGRRRSRSEGGKEAR